MLIDTNLIIYAVQPDRGGLRRWITSSLPRCSVISRVEALGYHRLSDAGRQALEAVFAHLTVHQPTVITFEEAIRLRRLRKMSLGDALIAATALEHHETLATANVSDFQWIDNLKLVNPLE